MVVVMLLDQVYDHIYILETSQSLLMGVDTALFHGFTQIHDFKYWINGWIRETRRRSPTGKVI